MKFMTPGPCASDGPEYKHLPRPGFSQLYMLHCKMCFSRVKAMFTQLSLVGHVASSMIVQIHLCRAARRMLMVIRGGHKACARGHVLVLWTVLQPPVACNCLSGVATVHALVGMYGLVDSSVGGGPCPDAALRLTTHVLASRVSVSLHGARLGP